MVRHLYSKIAITIYLLIAIGLGFWGYSVFKQRDGKVVVTNSQQAANSNNPAATSDNQNQSTATDQSSTTCTNGDTCNPNPAATDNSANTNTDNNSTSQTTVDSSVPPVASSTNVSGSMLAHITPEHCSSNCQAFASDLSLFEYCQQVCGITPIKKVSNCDDKKDIQKDYCLKDLAIGKEDASKCNSINDANIKQTCKNRIAQDIIENQ